jgi:hypothetical protein
MTQIDCALSLVEYEPEPVQHESAAFGDSREHVDRLADQLELLNAQLQPIPSIDAAIYLAVVSDVAAAADREVELRALQTADIRADVAELRSERFVTDVMQYREDQVRQRTQILELALQISNQRL